MSYFSLQRNSELYQINHNKNKTQYQTISNELASVIKQGLYYSELSKGTFDITIGAVSSLWDFKSDKATLPNETLLKESLKTVITKEYSIRILKQ